MAEPLLERTPVLAGLREALAAARAGQGGAAFVQGAAGIGKTSVLDALEADAGDGVRHVRIRGEEMESGVPFGVLDQLLRALAGPREAGPSLERSVPFLHALSRVEQEAGTPLLVIADDLHWADADSLAVLAFLARRLGRLPVLLVGALRPWPPAATTAAAALEAAGAATVHPLHALSPASSHELLERCLGGPPPEATAARAWERCQGNPLLTVQVGAALQAGRDPLAQPGGGLLVARFTGLGTAARALVGTAALMGVSFRPEVAIEVAGLDATDGDHALTALHGAGLVTEEEGGRLRFSHPLVAAALREDLVPAVRRRQHARAFRALARRGLVAEAAEHAVRADLTGDVQAAELLERLGRTALAEGALEGAVRHLEAAARLRGEDAPPRTRLVLAEALCAVGQAARATEACDRVLAAPGTGVADRVEALTLRGRASYLLGRPAASAADLDEAVAVAERHEPAAAVVPLLQQTVSLWMAAGPRAALGPAERARRLAATAPPALRERVEARWGGLAAETGDLRGVAATAGAARWLEGVPLPPEELVTPLASIYPFAHCAQYVERFDDCAAALELAHERIEAAGAATASAMVSLFLGNHLLRRGRLADALAAADRAGRWSEFTPLTVPVAGCLRALALVWMGRTAEGRSAAAQARDAAPEAWLIRLWAAFADGLAGLWAGDPAAAEHFTEVERVLDVAGIREPNHTQWLGHGVAAHLLAGDRAAARRLVADFEPVAAAHPSRWPRCVLALCRARIAEHEGEDDAALAGYAEALDALGDVDLPLQRAEVLLAHGRLLRRRGEAVVARPPLAEAARIAGAHGARPLEEVARLELRLAGGRRRREHDRDRLTLSEQRVARMAAGGLSNAEIAAALQLSTNTVATHLRRVYAKLGVPGRRRLDLDALGPD